ncbi:hypothetical protein PVA17_22225, partial [Lysinibacillus sp. CNPSo 3705]|uniref:hypothetical protein n=1 Tax=Lysinibacillus sp. CNPSo 3705 TaxID=3028148 RepID=UPI002364690C
MEGTEKAHIFSHCEVFNDLIVEYLTFFIWHSVTLLLFSEAFRSLSAGERRASSYASLRAGSRL